MIALHQAGHWFQPSRWLFRHLSLTPAPAQITAILGPNGTGKTTLLRALCGILTPKEGALTGSEVVGYVPQALHADQAYSALDMVLLGRSRFLGRFDAPGRKDLARARACLEEVGLSSVADARYDRLSGGQRQLVLLARALASDARVLVLDEPVSALDLANQGIVLRLLRRLADQHGLAVLFTTHHPEHALGIADRALLMFRDGEHVEGGADTVVSEANLERMYGVPVRRLALGQDDASAFAIIPLHGLRSATTSRGTGEAVTG
ncbi:MULTISPECIES: ABC transporter ATP-binding protein [unclassified Beijerinckia]|uniref:ABC transporter ATP-binding protein n=1 Tax=unclassified Beijerinckia TaxID=2638183 RepID=UPI00089B0849|nr:MULTISPECIES: ABC transporter ATP-binding protein [unclassified Beijerinckia]MDH7794591.1 iron complex transport system ATP-binding protein [Beijerinckia sp. GAS462]SEB67747.1 iron complex transport system ATP-binding protein [Beijerinckia sp. 28-YEA-48]